MASTVLITERGDVEPKGLRYNNGLMRQLQVINVHRQVDS